jgi:uncharacterized protein
MGAAEAQFVHEPGVRFSLLHDGVVVSHADYSVDREVIVIPHVETDPRFRGQGWAARLLDEVVEHVRSERRTIRPICWYAAAYLRDRPETADVTAST